MNKKLQPLKLLLLILCLGCAGAFLNSCDDEEKPKTEPVVTTGEVTDITTESATVSGEITDDGNAEITVSGFVYSSIVGEPTTADDKVELSDIEGDISALLEALSSGTTYHVRAYAINSVGTGYGEVVDFSTGNAAPTASDLVITGDVEVNKELTATYTYSDPEEDEEGTSTFQWYVANDAAGAGEAAIAGATELTYTIQEAQNGKYIRFGVTPKATAGELTGTEVRSAFVGAVGEATTVTFTYRGQEVTYGIITSSTGKKWMDRNLGAPNAPTAFDDYANYGDLFQWGRGDDGHQVVIRSGPNDADMSGPNGMTSTVGPFEYSSTDAPGHLKFIVVGSSTSPFDWRSPQNNNLWQGVTGINNPCPLGWRIATAAEWTAENLGTLTEAYTKLKITRSGIRSGDAGAFLQAATAGRYWTSTIDPASPTSVVRTSITSTATTQSSIPRSNGYPCRCIKN